MAWLVWLGFASTAHATDYTWTNTATGASGYWTNGNLATPANYPGSNAASDNAYLTNNTGAGGSFTNILNRPLNFVVGTLAISNSTGGQSWLIVTNAALTNTTFTLGNGGGLEIDSGGLLTNTTTFNWLGTNGGIVLNNNGTLITAGSMIFGKSAASLTGQVASASSAGQGGTWQVNGQLAVGTNSFGLNSLTLSNATLLSAGGQVGVGASSNLMSVLAGGSWNLQGNILVVGAGPYVSTGNTVLVSGSGAVITNLGSIGSINNPNGLVIGKVYEVRAIVNVFGSDSGGFL